MSAVAYEAKLQPRGGDRGDRGDRERRPPRDK